ncbi:MAG TPA: glycoside hydrolase family 16 protein [Candidatus Krumholzibacteria bacterium]|nr:glycoside hydrolase family 16 protein [Candidatus Krumholzibacteria bacterium]
MRLLRNPRLRVPLLVLLLSGLVFLVPACGDDDEDEGTYVLTWSDEFDGPADTSPDPEKWTYDIGTGVNGWGNAQLEYDTDRIENVRLDGEGHLEIVAREEEFGDRQYTSARIKTEGLFTQRYGRFEARIQLPRGQGIWPAFWMLGDDFRQVGWPDSGEIDIMEYRGQNPDEVLGTVHGPGYSGGASIGARFILDGGDFDAGFHVFSIEWTDDRITWFVDDVPYHRVRPQDLGGREWVFDHPFFMILNVAVGGNFVGPPDETTRFPQTMRVDWVRVYERQ